MKKEVEFFDLVLNKRKQLNLFGNDETTLSDKVQRFSENHTESDKVQVNGNKIFTLITFDKDHIFGSFGKLEDYDEGHHIRNRNKEDYTIEDFKYFVEKYSYFYIDLASNNIALLKRSGLPDIKKPLNDLISFHFNISGPWEVDIVPKITDTIDNIVGKPIPVSKINYKVVNGNIPKNDFFSIENIFDISTDEITNATVRITLTQGSETTITKFQNKLNGFSEMKLENDRETIDIIEQVITKKSVVEIDQENLHNLDVIKDLLLGALRTES